MRTEAPASACSHLHTALRGANQGIPSWSRVGMWRTLPFMFAATVIEAPLNLEPVSPDSFIADLEPRSRDA